ncbi:MULTISPECIES: hypothetical protein [unclassified Microcoleus]|uniref:hypothetical protein n=2 Tax=unclassified Microcoleus TaxID=2642155 RepID=UPI002FD5BAEA
MAATTFEIGGQEIAKYADSRQETVGFTGPIIIEMQGRETIDAVMVLGDIVFIGHTVLDTFDLLVDCKNPRLIPNPENPERFVLRVHYYIQLKYLPGG